LNTHILDRFVDYYLDPHSDKTIIKTNENIMPHVNISFTKGVLNFNRFISHVSSVNETSIIPKGEIRLKPSQRIKITIGLAGIKELSIFCDNNQIFRFDTNTHHLKTIDTIKLNKLNIHSGQYYNIDLMVDLKALHIDNRPFSSIKVVGNTDQMDIKSERKGTIDASNLRACNTSFSVYQSSDIQINSSCQLSGFAKTQSKIVNHSKASQNDIVLISANYSEI